MTEAVASGTGSYVSSEFRSSTAMVTSEPTSPSMMSSSTPVTVTSFGVSQSAGVNVSVVGETVASVRSPADRSRTTFEVGSEASSIVNTAVVPLSDTLTPPPSTTVSPDSSSSVVVTDTVWSASASKASSELASSTLSVTTVTASPSSMSSFTPDTVTVCGVSQFDVGKTRVEVAVDTSPMSSLTTSMETEVAGSASSTTVNWSIEPPSVTAVPPVSTTVKPATSLSTVETETIWSARPSKREVVPA